MMKKRDFDTLVDATNYLMDEGYTESFKAGEKAFIAIGKNREYDPKDLLITHRYRFEGKTNPADSMELMAIKTTDGLKGTFVMSYGAKHSQNAELVKQVRREDKEEM